MIDVERDAPTSTMDEIKSLILKQGIESHIPPTIRQLI